jgi:hypothetical protein
VRTAPTWRLSQHEPLGAGVLRAFAYFGVARSASETLLECKEDLDFYTWSLLDPKDSPYATFRYHYRSWAKLQCLNVVSTRSPLKSERLLRLEPIAEVPFALGVTTTPDATGVVPECSAPSHDNDVSVGNSPSRAHGSPESPEKAKQRLFSPTKPPEVLQPKPSSPRIPQPSKKTRDGYSGLGISRSLPPLPSRPARRMYLSSGSSTGSPSRKLNPTESSTTRRLVAERQSGYAPTPTRPRLSCEIKSGKKGGGTAVPCSDMENARLESSSMSPSPPSLPSQRQEQQTPTRVPAHPPHHQTLIRTGSRPLKLTADEAGCREPPARPVPKDNPPYEVSAQGSRLQDDQYILGPGTAHGIHGLPRGLLGPALTEIPLRGPTGELMKRLRKEDPFRGS